MEEDHEKIHFQGEDNATGLIDFSNEDDTLVLDATAMQQTQSSENWKEFSNFDLMGSTSIDAGKERDIVGSNHPVESYPDLIKSPEPERAMMRKGKCNLRKSLAWDSAFFTNAGVLDPEELSSMIGDVAEKSGKHTLPQIVEDDVSESTDSISTLESDNLEVGFFEDIRASIQKSSVAIDKTSIKAVPKKVDPATKNKVKQKAAMEKPNMIPKAALPLMKQNIRPRGEPMKQEPQGTNASRLKRGKSVNPAAQGIKGEKGGSSIATKAAEALKLPANNNGARRRVLLPQPASSSKPSSSLSSSSSITKNEVSRLSSDSSKSLRPLYATISPVKAAREKLGNRIAKTGQRDRDATLMPSRNSSSLSPSSEQSSASSTSAYDKSRTSFDKTCRSSHNDNFPLNLDLNSDQRFEEYENGGRALTGTLSHPASLKPSGLRRPSPSIGFFDGVKTVRTPKGLLQHGGIPLPSSPKVGSTLSRPNREIIVKPNTKKHPSTSQFSDDKSTKVGSTLSRPNQEIIVKPNTKKHPSTSQFSDDKSTDSRPSRQGGDDEEAARDAEIHRTNTDCDDESLMLSSRQQEEEDLFAKVAAAAAAAEKEVVKVCASAALINQCDQKENGVSEKQVVGGGATVFSTETLNNNSRDPLVDIEVAACSSNNTQEHTY